MFSPKIKNTKQRCHILDCMAKNVTEHLTVEDIFISLAKSGFNVSRATIYRCVSKLLKEGLIKKYKLNSKSSACYQYISKESHCDSHCHLVCLNCNKVIHFKNDEILNLQRVLNEEKNFLLDIPRSSFFGLCESCRKGV